MPHPPRHSRPKLRQESDRHALGFVLEEVDSRRAPAAHRGGEEHAEQWAEQAQQYPEATAPPSRQVGAHASLTAPNRDPPVAVRPLDARAACWRPLNARAACCGRTSDMLHEAYRTGDAATCTDSSSHMHAACACLKAEHEETGMQAPALAFTAVRPNPPPAPPHATPMEMMVTLKAQLLDTNNIYDKEGLVQLMSELQIAQTIVVQRIVTKDRSSSPRDRRCSPGVECRAGITSS